MDDPELKNLLHEDIRLAEENNVLLRKLYRRTHWVFILSLLKWIILVGVTSGAFYFLKPYIETFSNSYQVITGQHLPDFSKYFGK